MALEIERKLARPASGLKTPGLFNNLFAGSILNLQQGHGGTFAGIGGRRVKDRDRMFFTEQLALLLETGVSLQEALQSLQAQTNNEAMRQLIVALASDIREGRSFSQALARHPAVFSQTYVNLIAASETGGFMFQVLEELREMDEKRERMNTTLHAALAYPVFLMVFSVAVVIFVLLVVFPKFSEMFTLIHDQLPLSTKLLMGASEILQQYWLLLIASVVGAVLLVNYWRNTEQGQHYLDKLKLEFPVIKQVFIELYLVQILRVMSLSMSKGVSVMDTLASCREIVNNRLFQQFIEDVERRVQAGEGIAVGFSQSVFIPQVVQQLISTGDQAGNLPRVMARAASYYERQLEKRLTALSKAAEPVMLLVMGAVVGILVSSLILPIFKLSRAVG